MMNIYSLRKRGFTLMEMIVVLALIVFVIAGLSFPVVNFLEQSSLNNASQELMAQLKKAQSYALMNLQASRWGVYLDNENQRFVFFRGDTWNQSPSSHIEFPLPSKIQFQNISLDRGNPQVIFEPNTGNTLDFGSFQIYNINRPDNPYTLSVNQLGIIEFSK